MKPILIFLLMSFGLVTGALAQTSNDSSVPMNKPDPSPPSLCGPSPTGTTLEAADATDSPPASPNTPEARKRDHEQIEDLQCAGNAPTLLHSDAPLSPPTGK